MNVTFSSLSLCPSLSPLSVFDSEKIRPAAPAPAANYPCSKSVILATSRPPFPLPSLSYSTSVQRNPLSRATRHRQSVFRIGAETRRGERAHPSKRFRFRASDIMMEYYADRRDLSERAQQEGYTYQVAAARGCLFVIRNIYIALDSDCGCLMSMKGTRTRSGGRQTDRQKSVQLSPFR